MRRLLAFAVALALCAEQRMTVEQLRAFVDSSRRLGHADKQVAEYLKNVRLTQRLEGGVIEELQANGAGPRTVEALRKLGESARTLPAPPPPAPKQVVLGLPPADSMEQARALHAAREYARDYTRSLPNFICTQVTRRYVDPSGLEFWQRQDVIVTKLSFFEQKEDYKVVLINNRPVDTSMHKVGGATSTGEFGTLLKELFDPATDARFEWERWATLRGKRMHVFSYRVAQPRSKYTIVWEKTYTATPGYTGLVYVDREAHTIMRITQDVREMPAGFPVSAVHNVLDYDNIAIAGSPYVLPLKASTTSRAGKMLFKNETEFRMYNRFGTDTVITFAPDPLPEEDTKEQPAAPDKK